MGMWFIHAYLLGYRKPNTTIGAIGSESDEVDPKGKAVIEELLSFTEWSADDII